MTQDTVIIIDARGLGCPLPVLRLRKRVLSAPPGASITLLATDRAALRDVPVFCAAQGLAVGEVEQCNGEITFHIVKLPA